MNERYNNSGILFKNTRRQKDKNTYDENDKKKDNQPLYTGHAVINNIDYYMSAWVKKDKNGNSFMTFAFKPKEDTEMDQRPTEDDLPF